MNMQDQCSTLPQSKRLKQLGVKQVSEFSWYEATDVDDIAGFNRSSKNACNFCGHPVAPYIEEVSAFTVAELGVLFMKTQVAFGFYSGMHWKAGYKNLPWVYGTTEAECRANLLIQLIEHGEINMDLLNRVL